MSSESAVERGQVVIGNSRNARSADQGRNDG
jgi:hypothetical protein